MQASGPGARANHAMDLLGQKVVLVHGGSADKDLHDLWSLDLATCKWRVQLSSLGGGACQQLSDGRRASSIR